MKLKAIEAKNARLLCFMFLLMTFNAYIFITKNAIISYTFSED